MFIFNKKTLSLFVSMLLVATLVSCSTSTTPTEDKATENSAAQPADPNAPAKLIIWDWDEEHLNTMTELYTAKKPNITFEKLVVSTADYMQKLQSSLSAGTDIPDILLGELSFRGRLFDLGILEDLSKAPYNVNKEEMFDFAVEFQTGPNGELLGVEQQICPTGFAFRRDLAKEYLGTDDPAELAKLIPDWEKFTALGKEIKAKSGGKVVIFPGVSGMLSVLINQTSTEYINGNTIELTKRYKSALDQATMMNQADIFGGLEGGSPALSAGFAEGKFIFYPMASWGMKWTIEINDPNGKGNWGLVKAPGDGFTYGGTSVSIYSGSKYKQAAWDYIKDTYYDGEGVKIAYDKFGFMSGVQTLYTEDSYYFTQKGVYDEFFGGQEMTKYFINEISLNAKGQVQTKNESMVLSALEPLNPQMAENKNMTGDEALEVLKKEVLTLIPEAEIK